MKIGWIVHPRNLIVYVVLVAATVLTVRYSLTPWVVGTVLATLLAVYYFVLPALALRGLPGFDNELRKLLVKGDPDKLLAFYKSHLMLRAFAPPGLMKHRLGQVHAARRVWPLAFQSYYEALRAARVKDRFPVLLGFAEAGFHAGEDGEIRNALVELARDPRIMSSATFMLVHVMIADGSKPKAVRKLIGEWQDTAVSDGDAALHALAEAEALGLEGKRAKALERLAEIDRDQLPEAIRPLAALLEAKIHHVEGRKKKARRLFDEVRKDPAAGRGRLELREFLEE
jgi:hypothetical protein